MPTLSTILTSPTISAPSEPAMSILAPGNVDYYFVYDGAAFADYTTEANEDTINDTPLLPAVLAGTAHYVGMNTKFVGILYEVGTAAAGNFSSAFYYSVSGGWALLPEYFGMESDINGFRVAERHVIALLPETNFDKYTVNGQLAYWVRFRNTNTGSGYVQPLANRIRIYPPGEAGQIMRLRLI